MTADPGEGPASAAAVLRAAAALVFVDDLADPRPDEEDLHHLRDVLRLAAGERVICCDGRGSWRLSTVSAALAAPRARRGRSHPAVSEESGAPLSAVGSIHSEAPATPRLAVGFPLLKGDRTEWTVQKLTELGIDEIIPLVTQRSVVRPDAAAGRRRGDRLRRVAREAASQSRRVFLPEVADPVPLAEVALGDGAFAEPGGGPLDDSVTRLFVGPEGGWTAEELALGGATVSLGPGVLRAETAALVCGVLLAARRSNVRR